MVIAMIDNVDDMFMTTMIIVYAVSSVWYSCILEVHDDFDHIIILIIYTDLHFHRFVRHLLCVVLMHRQLSCCHRCSPLCVPGLLPGLDDDDAHADGDDADGDDDGHLVLFSSCIASSQF